MSRKWLFILITCIMIITLAACTGAAEVSTTAPGEKISEGAPEDTDTDTAEGHDNDDEKTAINAADIFSQRCSGCHGADREGDKGPPLLPKALTKDPSVYVNTITNGSGPMPSWESRLSADEINALVEFILSEVE